MSSKETRRRLIHAIAERQFDGAARKILIGDIATAVGITRQAFNRYYGDLKPYITGNKPIAELLSDETSANTSRYLVQNQETITALEAELQASNTKHNKELQRVTENYITTLMNNDITLWQVDKTRATVERQNALIQNYSTQISDLKLKITNIETDKFNQTIPGKRPDQRILLEPSLALPIEEYRKNGDSDKFEVSKDAELQKLANRASVYTDDSRYIFVIFLDLYLCSFHKFADNHVMNLNKTYIFIRLPLFTSIEVNLFLKSISKCPSAALFIPTCKSENEKIAQRKFHFRSIPESEFKQADKVSTFKPQTGIREVTYYTVNLGE